MLADASVNRSHGSNPKVKQVRDGAFGLVDEWVFHIRQDYAGDPRQSHFGTKRPQTIQTQSMFNQKQYVKLVEGAEKQQ